MIIKLLHYLTKQLRITMSTINRHGYLSKGHYMSAENEILKQLVDLSAMLDMPATQDQRKSLPQSKSHTWKARIVSKIKGMCWHQALGEINTAAIARYHSSNASHLRKGGVQTISYTWSIEKDGRIILCNDFKSKTWSQGTRDIAGDENALYMSVCFCGNFRGKGHDKGSFGPTQEQMNAGENLWRVCRNYFKWSKAEIKGHFDFGKPACPGHVLETMITSMRHGIEADLSYDSPKGRQALLNHFGANLVVDGLWGKKSTEALKAFQNGNLLVPDGIWGKKTEAVINELLGA